MVKVRSLQRLNSGASVAQGYWNQLQQTKEAFQAYLADEKTEPFLRTENLTTI